MLLPTHSVHGEEHTKKDMKVILSCSPFMFCWSSGVAAGSINRLLCVMHINPHNGFLNYSDLPIRIVKECGACLLFCWLDKPNKK